MEIKNEIKQLAIKHNLTQSDIKKIWQSQFKYVTHIISLDYNTKGKMVFNDYIYTIADYNKMKKKLKWT